jgi:hypothetical protein
MARRSTEDQKTVCRRHDFREHSRPNFKHEKHTRERMLNFQIEQPTNSCSKTLVILSKAMDYIVTEFNFSSASFSPTNQPFPLAVMGFKVASSLSIVI